MIVNLRTRDVDARHVARKSLVESPPQLSRAREARGVENRHGGRVAKGWRARCAHEVIGVDTKAIKAIKPLSY